MALPRSSAGRAGDVQSERLRVDRCPHRAGRQGARQACTRLREVRLVHCGARGGWDAQAELAGLRKAIHLADQPVSTQLHVERRAAEGRRHGDGHRQQQGPFVPVVDERPDRQALRRGPFDGSRGGAGGQLPAQRGGEAGIARVHPVGVPLGRMLDQQAEPERLAGRHAVGRVCDQLGAHLVRSSPTRLALTPGKAPTGSARANDAGWTWDLGQRPGSAPCSERREPTLRD